MSDFQVTVKEVDNVVVLATDGYLNNIGGEKISEICDEYLDKGKNMFLINLEKSTVVNWFSKKGLETLSCSDSIRAWLAGQNIEPTRDALIEGGRELRRNGGAGVLAEMLLEILDGKDAVVDSIRTPGEVEALRKRDDFMLIEIRANTETRWERLQSRARAGDPLDKETFMEQENAEAVAKDAAGQALNATAELADIVILNDGTEQELLSDLEELYMKLK